MKRMCKKGVGIFAIPPVVAAFIIFLFRMWAVGEVIDAVTPELEKALLELDNSIVCPPEFNNGDFQVCISGKGEVIVNGNVNEALSFELSSDARNEQCHVRIGEYVDVKACQFADIHKLENFNLLLKGKNIEAVVNSKNIELYLVSSKFIKIPVKKWKGIMRVIRYIPK